MLCLEKSIISKYTFGIKNRNQKFRKKIKKERKKILRLCWWWKRGLVGGSDSEKMGSNPSF